MLTLSVNYQVAKNIKIFIFLLKKLYKEITNCRK